MKIVYNRITGEITKEREFTPEENQFLIETMFRNFLRANPEYLSDENLSAIAAKSEAQ